MSWKQRVQGSHKKNKFSNVNHLAMASQEDLSMPIEDTSYQIDDDSNTFYI